MKRLNGPTEDDVKSLTKKWFDGLNAWSYAPIQRGMGVHGIPDRVGCVPVKITQEMVGMTVGLFVAPECKKPGRRLEVLGGLEPSQKLQLDGILDASGVGALVDGQLDLDSLTRTMVELRQGRKIAREVFARRIGDNG